MSKELEALENMKNDVEQADTCYSSVEDYNLLKQSLTPPTEEEVCKALSDELGVPVYYNQPYRYFYYEVLDISERNKREIIICTFTKRSQNHKEETLQIKYDFTPYLMTMISRFYEKESERE